MIVAAEAIRNIMPKRKLSIKFFLLKDLNGINAGIGVLFLLYFKYYRNERRIY